MRFEELFNVWYGVNLEVVNSEVTDKRQGIPFVSRQSVNNGVVCYVKRMENVNPNPKHTLSIAVSGSVLSTFYHDYEYYSGRDIYVAEPKEEMSSEEMLFYAYVLEKNKYRYNYGRGANKTFRNLEVPSLKDVRIELKKLDDFQLYNLSFPNNVQSDLATNKWEAFRYEDIFLIEKGKRLTKADMVEGDINYIGATDSNNGITAKIGNTEHVLDGNKITVSYNGSIAEAYYQEERFWATDDVNVLTLKDHKLNKYIAMFFCTLISIEKYRFNYGRKWDKELMKQSLIKLPVDPHGNPDWQFMEDYIKSLPYSANL